MNNNSTGGFHGWGPLGTDLPYPSPLGCAYGSSRPLPSPEIRKKNDYCVKFELVMS